MVRRLRLELRALLRPDVGSGPTIGTAPAHRRGLRGMGSMSFTTPSFERGCPLSDPAIPVWTLTTALPLIWSMVEPLREVGAWVALGGGVPYEFTTPGREVWAYQYQGKRVDLFWFDWERNHTPDPYGKRW